MTDISAIILTFNEERNLPAAIDSVAGWAKEIFVVDSFSTDATVAIARSRADDGVRLWQHEFIDYAAQWNWAIENLPVRTTWTLKLDADERATAPFRREVSAALAAAPGSLAGLRFRRRFHFLGKALRFGGVQSNYDLRLWRTGQAVCEQRAVNEHILVRGDTGRLRSWVDHHDNKSLTDWLDKHNRYSSLEAINVLAGNVTGEVAPRLFGTPAERRMWLRKAYYRVPGRAAAYFLFRYVVRLGFLDGRPGLRYALLHAAYRYWIDLKTAEARRTGESPEVRWPARAFSGRRNVGLLPEADVPSAARRGSASSIDPCTVTKENPHDTHRKRKAS